jgi:streptogramin lyase
MRTSLLSTAVFVVACGSETPAPSPPRTPATTASSAAATSTPAPTTAVSVLSACPQARAVTTFTVLSRPGGRPDDLALAPDGSLWVSDPDNGTVWQLDNSGRVVRTVSDPNGPEGMVFRADGTMLLAEQKPNRIVTLPPPYTSTQPFVDIPNRSGRMGIDGLGVDDPSRRLLIPDSPHGVLDAVPLNGGTLVVLASGMSRPVSATTGPDGSVYVVDEGTTGLWRVPASGGSPMRVGSVSGLDDVVSSNGLLYGTAINAGTVLAIDPRTGESRTLVTSVQDAQGLAVLPDGRLALADSTRGIVVYVDRCGSGG